MTDITLLVQILEKQAFTVFTASEIDEAILSIYLRMRVAIRYECDTFEIASEYIRGLKDGSPKMDFPAKSLLVYEALRDAFLKIHGKDPIVQKHFKLELSNQNKVICKIFYK